LYSITGIIDDLPSIYAGCIKTMQRIRVMTYIIRLIVERKNSVSTVFRYSAATAALGRNKK
jgi:hypothetical protein